MGMQKLKGERNMELKYSYRALVELEKNNINVFDIDNHRNFVDLKTITRCGLLHEKEYTEEEMFDVMDTLLTTYDLAELFELLVIAISYSISGGKIAEEEDSDGDSEKKK
jgi:hypothetical protein